MSPLDINFWWRLQEDVFFDNLVHFFDEENNQTQLTKQAQTPVRYFFR